MVSEFRWWGAPNPQTGKYDNNYYNQYAIWLTTVTNLGAMIAILCTGRFVSKMSTTQLRLV